MKDEYFKANLDEIFREINFELKQNYFVESWSMAAQRNNDAWDKVLTLKIDRNPNIALPDEYTQFQNFLSNKKYILHLSAYFVAQQYCVDKNLSLNNDEGLDLFLTISQENENFSFNLIKEEIILSILDFYLDKFKKLGYKIMVTTTEEDGRFFYDLSIQKI